MPKWDYCGQSNLLGSEGKEEDGEDIAYCKTARVLNKHLLRRPINARSRARHGEEGWRYEPRFVSKSQWYLRVEIWACQLGRKSQERRKGERERWGRGRREKGWSRILKEIWRSELPGSNGKDAVWMPVRSRAEFVWSKLCIWSKLCLWMPSPTRWTWVWASSGTWWWTGRPGIATVHGVTKSWTGMSYWTDAFDQRFRVSCVPHGSVTASWCEGADPVSAPLATPVSTALSQAEHRACVLSRFSHVQPCGL